MCLVTLNTMVYSDIRLLTFGDSTPSTVGSHEETYSVDLSSYGVEDYEKTTVLAMLVDNTGKVVLNAQFAEVNLTQSFD